MRSEGGSWTAQFGGEGSSFPVPDEANEQTTSLSPEPWENPLAAGMEPPMWQPPPPRRRSRALPWVLTGLGVWVLAAVAIAIVMWPKSDNTAGSAPQQDATTVEETVTGGSATPSAGPSAGDATARQQAGQIDALLNDMAGTRTELGSVVAGGCDTSGLQRIRDQRQEQLSTAETLQVDALADGESLKSALTEALRISVESNDLYLSFAPGCPSDDAAAGVNDRATQAKAQVISYWNNIAGEYGLPTRDSGTI